MSDLIYPKLSYKIVGTLYDVYNAIGGGYQEKYYQRALTKELAENREERQTVDEQNSAEGDRDSPNEQASADELAEWDSLIHHTKETMVEIINWLAR